MFYELYHKHLDKIHINYRWELEIDNDYYNQIIEVLENSKSKNFNTYKRRYFRKTLFIKIINNKKIIFYKDLDLNSDIAELKLLLKKDEIYYQLGKLHSESIHGGQKELWNRAKKNFGNIKQWITDLFVNACKNCQERNSTKNSTIAGNIIISNHFLSRIQVSYNI
jgi:hypothetical protein